MKRKNLYERAIKHYGIESQMTMAIEEMSELTKEICKTFRGTYNEKNLVDEIADVEIMLEQLKQIHDLNEKVYKRKEHKKKRLEKRLDDEILGNDKETFSR